MDEFCGTVLANASSWWQPHGHCVVWSPWFTWTWTACGILTWLAYLAIPVTLWRNLRGTRLMVALPWMAPFILACGFSHLFDAVVVWRPYYWLSTGSHVLTTFVSMGSAIGLSKLLPVLRAHREVDLVTQQQEAQLFVDCLADAAFISSRDGGNLAVNPAFESLLGTGLEGAGGYHWALQIHPDDRDQYVTPWLDFVAGRADEYKRRCRWKRPSDGKWLTIETRGGRRTNGQFYGTVRSISKAQLALEAHDGIA